MGLLAGVVALFPALPSRADPAAARAELARSVALFRNGNATAARDHARAATKLDPNWGLAHAVLARSFLELDEGAAAEAELDRAKAVGFDAKRVSPALCSRLISSRATWNARSPRPTRSRRAMPLMRRA